MTGVTSSLTDDYQWTIMHLFHSAGFDNETCFTICQCHKVTANQTEAFISPKLVLRTSSIYSRNKLMIPIVLSLSLWMFSVWLVFTSNMNSQTTWLKVKFKLVNFRYAPTNSNRPRDLISQAHTKAWPCLCMSS